MLTFAETANYMERDIHITLEQDTLIIQFKPLGAYQLTNLPDREKKCLQDYFDLLGEEYQDDLTGVNKHLTSPYIVNALLQHICSLLDGSMQGCSL